jgi:AraC-like DNA-binding protein
LRARDCPEAGDQLHAIPTLVVCLAGAVRVEGGPRGRADLRAGEALVIPPTARHRHSPLRGASQCLDLGFVADLTDFDLIGDGARVWGRAPRDPYRSLVERMLRSGSSAERVELARRLCGELADERLASMRYPHPALSRMLAVLWRFTPGTTAADLLRASRLRPSQAHAVFKAFFAESPKQAILSLRLGMARHLLDEGAGIAEAAARSGFPRRADLTRAWRNRFGRPPRLR